MIQDMQLMILKLEILDDLLKSLFVESIPDLIERYRINLKRYIDIIF